MSESSPGPGVSAMQETCRLSLYKVRQNVSIHPSVLMLGTAQREEIDPYLLDSELPASPDRPNTHKMRMRINRGP